MRSRPYEHNSPHAINRSGMALKSELRLSFQSERSARRGVSDGLRRMKMIFFLRRGNEARHVFCKAWILFNWKIFWQVSIDKQNDISEIKQRIRLLLLCYYKTWVNNENREILETIFVKKGQKKIENSRSYYVMNCIMSEKIALQGQIKLINDNIQAKVMM